MSILDLNESADDLVLKTLTEMFIFFRFYSNPQDVIFKWNPGHNISRIKHPERYLIYFDYIAAKPGQLRDDKGKLTVEILLIHKNSSTRTLYYPLSSHRYITLEDVYNFDKIKEYEFAW